MPMSIESAASVYTQLDEQMRLPQCPRLPEDIVKLWHNRETLVFLGGPEEVVLHGKSVRLLLPQLMPLLNGRLTIAEIAGRIPGVKRATIEYSLLTLYMNGLLEEGAVQPAALTREQAQYFNAQLKFFSRYVDVTRFNSNRYRVLERLQSGSVLLLGAGRAARETLREMLNLGVGRVDVVPLDGADGEAWREIQAPYARVELLDVDPAALADGDALAAERFATHLPGRQLILLVTDAPALRLTRLLNAAAVEHNVPFLRSRIGEGCVEVGPTVIPRESACYECAHLLHALRLDEGDDEAASGGAERGEWLTPEENLGVSRTALYVLSLLTKLISIAGVDKLHRLSVEDLDLEAHSVYRLVGCPTCSTVEAYDAARDLLVGGEHTENLPALYHFNTNERQYALTPKGHQKHYAHKIQKIVEGAFKSYATAGAIPLKEPFGPTPRGLEQDFAGVATRTEPPARREPVTITDVARLLLLSAGRALHAVVEDWPTGHCVTPSGGNLASQTLYLAAFEVEGLAAGLYHFNRVEGTLEPRGGGSLLGPLGDAVLGADALGGRPAAALIHTAGFGRVEFKYGFKAYRYCLYDSGAMLHSLETVGRMLGLELWHSEDIFDEEIRELLGLHTPLELPIYVAYVLQPTPRGARHREQS
jgi:SagB-type dehydrogenase family enzyme